MTISKVPESILIPFYSEEITILTKDEEILVPLKQLCNNLGVSWKGQHRRIKEDPVLRSVVSVTETTAIDEKSYDTLTLPLKYLNGFLFTISDKRLKSEETKKKLALYKTECYDVLFKYFNQGFALNVKKLENPSVQRALVSEVKKAAVTRLPFQSDSAQYTFLAENSSQYGKTILKHSLDSYFEMLSLVDSSIEFKDLKKGISRLASPSAKKLVAIKGIKGRQNLYDIDVFKAHLLSLSPATRESLSELGYDTVYNNLKKFIVENKDYCFDGEEGAISMHTDAFFEALVQNNKNYLLLRNIVYVVQCKNLNFYIGSHLTQMKDRFRDHDLVKNGNFKCFLFLIKCDGDFGAREIEQALFHKLSKVTLRAHEEFEKPGPYGFAVNIDTLISCVTDTFIARLPHLSFVKGDDLLQASKWVRSLR